LSERSRTLADGLIGMGLAYSVDVLIHDLYGLLRGADSVR
jgi:hypothetical protein